MSPHEVMKELGRQWSEADDSEKEQYQALADAAKAEFKKAVAAYDEEHKVK